MACTGVFDASSLGITDFGSSYRCDQTEENMKKMHMLVALIVVFVIAMSTIAMAAPSAPTGANGQPLGWWRANGMGLAPGQTLGEYMQGAQPYPGGYGPALVAWMTANGFK